MTEEQRIKIAEFQIAYKLFEEGADDVAAEILLKSLVVAPLMIELIETLGASLAAEKYEKQQMLAVFEDLYNSGGVQTIVNNRKVEQILRKYGLI